MINFGFWRSSGIPQLMVTAPPNRRLHKDATKIPHNREDSQRLVVLSELPAVKD